MPLITEKPQLKFDKIRLKIAHDLLVEIKAYCEAFGIKNIDNFLCEAAQYVLKTDRDWIKIQKEK
ncbi:MAG TPA: hypothetical protein PLV31_06330 [Gammaproteobacteria bacterium]|nr:hypothetical protein [Gammaproteobacteria bacterium]